MSERKPVKSLMDLKMTNWYVSRSELIKNAINMYPPGYYIFSGNGEVYVLTGWSDPVDKRQEKEVHIFLEREIPEGIETIRIHPRFMTPEQEVTEIREILQPTQEVIEEALEEIVETPQILGYYIGRETASGIQYLKSEGVNKTFATVSLAKLHLTSQGLCYEDQLDDFIYEPYYS